MKTEGVNNRETFALLNMCDAEDLRQWMKNTLRVTKTGHLIKLERALAQHAAHLEQPLDVLQRLGGFEIAALTGAYIHCAQQAVPVLVDGFISSTAALCATRICPRSEDWFLYSHRSAEPGHAMIMTALNAEPLLDLGMRLGEGSGAAVAAMLLRQACALHNDMATFAEAGVSET